MSDMKINLPDRIDSEIDRFVQQGEFINRDEAVEELLTLGLTAFDTNDDPGREPGEDLFTQATDDQVDPAADTDPDDEYTL
ncbi:CopG family transcriptional regulator [Halobacteriales archaeon QH_7_66_36]|jgi:Arc/MetJ-type ribon-helix-helix transcriptional regulator|nr:MAG: CopG family transcriptional regulator [Halobacteriales archaeon QH_7_66_36]